MDAVFFASTFLMLLVAASFAAAPLVQREHRRRDRIVFVPWAAVAAALLLSIGMYTVIGRPDIATGTAVPGRLNGASSAALPGASSSKTNSVGELVIGLERRLQEHPDDAKGWLLLAKSYVYLGRSQDAVMAYAKAASLGISDSVVEARPR